MNVYDYRDTLMSEYEDRCLRNTAYSLRAYARDLEIPVSRLSEIMNRKRGTSLKAGQTLCDQLSLDGKERELFLLSIVAFHGRSKRDRTLALEKLEQLERSSSNNLLGLDTFKVISDWHHYAILEYLSVVGVQCELEDICTNLGLTQVQARKALQRLEKVNLVGRKNNRYQALTEVSFTPNDIPAKTIKKHHEQILTKAVDALYLQDVKSREFGAVTLAFDDQRIDEVKKILRDCRRKIAKLADESQNKNSVYVLGTQFFRLDNKNQTALRAKQGEQNVEL